MSVSATDAKFDNDTPDATDQEEVHRALYSTPKVLSKVFCTIVVEVPVIVVVIVEMTREFCRNILCFWCWGFVALPRTCSRRLELYATFLHSRLFQCFVESLSLPSRAACLDICVRCDGPTDDMVRAHATNDLDHRLGRFFRVRLTPNAFFQFAACVIRISMLQYGYSFGLSQRLLLAGSSLGWWGQIPTSVDLEKSAVPGQDTYASSSQHDSVCLGFSTPPVDEKRVLITENATDGANPSFGLP